MRKSKLVFILAAAGALSGCASTPPTLVPDAQGIDPVSAVRMGCKKPWPLTQDCSGMSGPTRLIEINEVRFKVAGAEDERTTVMFGGTNIGNQGKTSNVGFEMMKRELVRRGHKIVSVTPIVSAGTVFGYAVQTESPSYGIWNEFSTE